MFCRRIHRSTVLNFLLTTNVFLLLFHIKKKCTVVGALVGGKVDKVNVQFRGVFGGIVGKMDQKLANRKKEPKAPTVERYTAPLHDLLNQFHVPRVIDYMSLDVEGAEFDIMQVNRMN
jgi:hypothetical protein